MSDFFDTLDLDGLDVSCLSEGASVPQYEDLVWTTSVYRALALTPNAPQSFIVPMVWAGICVLILFLGVFILPLSVLARMIDRRPAAELAALTGGARLTAWLAGVSGLAGLSLIGAGAARLMEDADAAIIAGLAASPVPAPGSCWLQAFWVCSPLSCWRARWRRASECGSAR